MSTKLVRTAAVIMAAAAAWYLPWVLAHPNPDALWLAIPFILANLLLIAGVALTAINHWTRSVPADAVTRPSTEPMVAVVIPTANEDPAQVELTVRSVADQSWPHRRLWMIVSDDGHSDAMAAMTQRLGSLYPHVRLDYHRPPARGDADRNGDAKAGNLNSALTLIDADEQAVEFIETRDADDLVGDPSFLSRCVAQLRADSKVAFVQTIKSAQVSSGDPFDNLQPHFFRSSMFARNASNAVFPCGSGLLWRTDALRDIGGFPTWNMVEDLLSGVLALRRGWKGVYLPIFGAVGQHAPEDIPNAYKQRGTWALDTMRLFFWGGGGRGLGLRQRLQFLELGVFYLQSFATLIFIISPAIGLIAGIYPLRTDLSSYVIHLWPFAIALELFLAAANRPHSYESLWRARELWVGLAPIYCKACVMALLRGPNRKPTYRVTRKSHQFSWYWRETLPQAVMLLLLVGAVVYGLLFSESPLGQFDFGSSYWIGLYVVLLGGVMRKSWVGTDPVGARAREMIRALPAISGGLAGLLLAGLALGGGSESLDGRTLVSIGAVLVALGVLRARSAAGLAAAPILAAVSLAIGAGAFLL